MSELADSSAWFASRRDRVVRDEFDALVARGHVATCDSVRMELLHTARNGREFSERRAQLDLLPHCPIGQCDWRRAIDVYEVLAHQGGLHHRRVKHLDLLIAAAAESAGVGVLHYDDDFETIAAVTGQPTRWLAPRGSL